MTNTDTKRRSRSGDEGGGPSALALKIADVALSTHAGVETISRKDGPAFLRVARAIDTEIRPLVDALREVQTALAADRDGIHYEHPEYGAICLEEVKYCVVDPALASVNGGAQ